MPKNTANTSPTEPAPGAGFQPAKRMVIYTVEQLKAFSDPLRVSIIELITREALTVKQIANRLGQPPTRLYYHVAELEKNGFVTQVDTRVKSGIIEKYYRTSAENITIDSKLLNTGGDQEGAIPAVLSAIFDTTAAEITHSIAAGLVNLQDLTDPKSSHLILLRSLYRIRSENLPKFIDKFTALLKELDAESNQAGSDPVDYACTIAFYPRVPSENQSQE